MYKKLSNFQRLKDCMITMIKTRVIEVGDRGGGACCGRRERMTGELGLIKLISIVARNM